MYYVVSEPAEITAWKYELCLGEDGVCAGIRDLTPGEAYGAVFRLSDVQPDLNEHGVKQSDGLVPTQHVKDFIDWNGGAGAVMVDPTDPEKKRLIPSRK